MSEQEMRELDGWIAEHIIGARLRRGDRVSLPTDAPVAVRWEEGASEGVVILPAPVTPPRFCTGPTAFSEVKREIKRRGWIWQAACCFEGGYDFAIHDPAGSVIHSLDSEETEVARILAVEHAETEELAGCLAFKAAVEAMDGENTD